MKLLVFLAGLALAASACGSVNDGDPGGDDGQDDGDDDMSGDDGSGDADAAPPGSPVVAAVRPDQLFENQGSGTGSRAFPIVVEGEGFAADAEIGAQPEGALVFEGPTVVNAAGTIAARLARVPLDDAAGAGSAADVTISVTQGGLTGSGVVEVVALDELVAVGGTLDASELAPLYSQVAIAGAVVLTGDIAARLVATGDIAVGAAIDAGSGSCAGGQGGLSGSAGDPGGCGAGGGRGASGTNAGGGGGGNATVGDPGTGTGAGSGGAEAGDAMLVPLGGADGTRGNGGGGGSGGNEGGAGGRGGGILELAAGGQILVGAEIGADGADGADGDAASGGGGGSGGVILLRSEVSVEVEDSVHAVGGAGGPGEAPTNGDGGAGGLGRIRVDSPQADLPGGIVPQPARGPMWLATTPGIATEEDLQLTFVGGVRTYFVSVNGGELVAAPVPGAGGQSIASVTLEAGLNTVCVHVVEGAAAQLAEARNCIAVALVTE